MRLTRRLLSLTLSLLLTATVMCGFAVPVGSVTGYAVRRNHPIKVGYLPAYGTLSEPSQEGKKGYGYDLFAQIASYTDWQYDYIPCDWEEGLALLESGAIDIFGPMQISPERQEKYLFPTRPFGYEFGTLYALNDAEIYYDDLDFFDGMKVGVFPGSYYTAALERYCQANNIEVELVEADALDSISGLRNGSFDTFVAGSLYDIPGIRVVAKISTEEFYYAVNKDHPELLDEINQAMEEIYQGDPYYYSKLHNKYYKDKMTAAPSFTKAERDFVSAYPDALRVVVEADTPPIQYLDKLTGKTAGISIELLRAIAGKSGLTFDFVPMHRNGDAPPEDIDISASFIGTSQLIGTSYTTLPYHEAPMVFVSNRDQLPQDARIVAMVESESMTTEAVLTKYPQFTLLPYQTIDQVLDAIVGGTADIALLSLYTYDDMAHTDFSGSLTVFPAGLSLVMNMKVSDALPPELVGILNKSIAQLSQTEISSIIFSTTAKRTRPANLADFARANALSISVISTTLLLIMLLLIIATVTSNRAKRKVLQHSEQALQNAAYLDNLTGTATALKFRCDAEKLLQDAKPGEYVLASLDVNHFKYINDMLGYEVGNQVLWFLAQQFIELAPPDVLMSRIYADNFVFLYREDTRSDPRQVIARREQVSAALMPLLGSDYRLQFSMGLYRVTDPTRSLSFMMDCASIAKKSAKGLYANSVVEYTEEMDLQLRTNREITLTMEQALQSGEFVPYLQPKIRLDSGELCGAEILVRWIPPGRKMILPMEFIPLFEKNGFIGRLDIYMFEQTCILLRRWMDDGRTELPRISVNISNITLADPDFVENILAISRQYNLNPALIEIEMTESALANSTTAMMAIMSHLKDAGFFVSIDDFGSGYSSFNLLKDVRADVLKIDKGFLSQTMNTEKGKEIISCIIGLSRRLQLETVAEGVETEEQADGLREMGCDIAQGYYYARPMPCAEFETRMTTILHAAEE